MEFALTSDPQPIQQLWLLRRLAQVALMRGDVDLVRSRYQAAVAVAVEKNLPIWESTLRTDLANFLIVHGWTPEAHEVIGEGLARNVEVAGYWRL